MDWCVYVSQVLVQLYTTPHTLSSCCSASFMLITNRILDLLAATAAATAGTAASGAAKDAPKLR